jgi:hypothetical protein
MPVDYSLGKIYKIVGNGKVYVGSTCERLLCQRFAGHRKGYNRWINNKSSLVTSYECLSDPECYIELLELCPCSCIDELRKCEGKWIRDLECVNRNIAGRSSYDCHKNYKEVNKEKYQEYHKNYYQINKEKMNAYGKEYREKIKLINN